MISCRPPPRAATPPEVIEARERDRELKELDRDTRTVFAYNLNLKADERDLFDFFSQAGEVRAAPKSLCRTCSMLPDTWVTC